MMWLSVVSVALGTFSIVTSEILPVGLLDIIADELNVSHGQAGMMMTMPAGIAVVAAPLFTLFSAHLDRRSALSYMMILLTVANCIAAVASNFSVMLIARALTGISIGGIWTIGSGIASRLVPAERVSRAMAIIFSGISLASVVGVPLGTFIGELSGWRSAFMIMAGVSLLSFVAIFVFFPSLPVVRRTSCHQFWGLFSMPAVYLGLLMVFFSVTGHFLAYTFLRPFLLQQYQVSGETIGLLLMLYGIAGVAGNFVFSLLAGRYLSCALLLSFSSIAIPTFFFLFDSGGLFTIATVFLLMWWGVGYGGVSMLTALWISTVTSHDNEAAIALYVSTFNVSISLGAVLGGRIVDLFSVSWVMVGCSFFSFFAVLTVIYAVNIRSHRKKNLFHCKK